MLRHLFMVALFTFGSVGYSAPLQESNWPWDIEKFEIKKVDETFSGPVVRGETCSLFSTSPLVEVISWDQILTIGEQVWKIIEAGKPVVHVKTPLVHALPRGLKCWTDLEHWHAPRTQTYQVIYTNGFGMEVVKFRFRLQYTYGGGKGGLGQYLANVTVMPAELNGLWGYTFDVAVEASPAVNLGSKDNPVAGLELNLRWTVSTAVQESVHSSHFFVQGDGRELETGPGTGG